MAALTGEGNSCHEENLPTTTALAPTMHEMIPKQQAATNIQWPKITWPIAVRVNESPARRIPVRKVRFSAPAFMPQCYFVDEA
jgi:hypothetical protein